MKKNLKAAALAVSFVCTLGAASAQEIDGSLTTNIALDNAWFIYGLQFGGGVGDQIAYLGSFEVGTSPFSVPAQSVPDALNAPYMFLATYSTGQGFGLVAGLNATAAPGAVGADFSTVFPGANETVVTNEVLTADTADLEAFYNTYQGSFATLGQSSTLMAFSNGTPVGSVTALATPEPASIAVLGLGVLALVRRRRN